MNAPDTIYIDGSDPKRIGTYFSDRFHDTDTRYVRADHSPNCTRFGPGVAGDDCTCGFTAALRGEA